MAQANIISKLRELLAVQDEFRKAEQSWLNEMRGSINSHSLREKLEQKMIGLKDGLDKATQEFLDATEEFTGGRFPKESLQDAISIVLRRLEELVPA